MSLKIYIFNIKIINNIILYLNNNNNNNNLKNLYYNYIGTNYFSSMF